MTPSDFLDVAQGGGPGNLTADKARFVEPMLLLRTGKLHGGAEWMHEIKFDGLSRQH